MADPLRLGILATHAVQYYAPWYRALAARPELDVSVFFAHQVNAQDHLDSGFNAGFEWDVPLLEGYRHQFLQNVAKTPGPSRFSGCDTPSIRSEIRRMKFDAFLVHGWGSKTYWQAMLACWRLSVPLMVRGDSHLHTPRSRLKKWAKDVAYPRFISRFDAYLCVGRRAKEYYLAYGARPERMVDCPHFVDNERFERLAADARPNRTAIRAQWGIPEDALCILFCGKLIPKKRPLDVAKAIALVRGRTGCQPLHLLVVGSGPLGSELRNMCHVVHNADADDGSLETPNGPPASFAGFLNQSQIARAYVAADVLVLPSDGGETWGLVVNEGMACGLPAVVSDQVGCAPDLVIENETGYAFPCRDVAVLAAILERLARDPELAPRLGRQACKRIASYSIETATNAVVATVQQLAQRRRIRS